MGKSKPPPSKAPAPDDADAAPAGRQEVTRAGTVKMPKFRQTMEVQVGWLDLDPLDPPKGGGEKPAAAPPSSRRGPPRIPGFPAIPPMPVPATSVAPKRRNTIDVEMDWVELVDHATTTPKKTQKEEPKRAAAKPPSARPSKKPSAPPGTSEPPPPSETTKPRPVRKKPIPREDD